MKQIIKITLSLLFIAASFTSCVDDKDFDTPQVTEIDNDIATTSLTAAKNNIIQNFQIGDPSTLMYTFPEIVIVDGKETNALYAPAYVVGDDSTGNFYKKLIVQDSPENPTAGIEIMINKGNLHTLYNVGRKIYIKLNGLTIGYFDGSQGGAPGYINQSVPGDNNPGVYKVGVLGDDFSIDRISDLDFKNVIIRSSVTETIVPKIISTDDISDATMNTFIQIDNMQFYESEFGKTFAGEVGDSYDASRYLLNCNTYYEMGVMTSTFSSFKSKLIPEGNGILKGVLMKNYREVESVIVLNSPDDIDFSGSDRCKVIFSENFDDGVDNTTFDFEGWTNFAEEGSELWSEQVYNNNGTVEFSAYSTGDDTNIGWLITPSIDLSTVNDNKFLNFKTQQHHLSSAANTLEVYISTDYDGVNVTAATWNILNDATIVNMDDDWYTFINSGLIDITSYSGIVYIGFKYVGSGTNTDLDGAYHVEDLKIMGQ